MRAKLIEEFNEQVPNSVSFNVGYFEGQQHSKVWLVSPDNLRAMYAKYPRGDITLWCDRSEPVEDDAARGRTAKRKREETTTRRQEKEEEVDEIFKDKHADKFSTPKLRLWARMVTSHLHEDLDNPPCKCSGLL